MSFTVEIPVPPGVNKSWRNVSPAERARSRKPLPGRLKTAAYRSWRTQAAWLVKAAVPAGERIGGHIGVTIALPTTCRLDIDGPIKGTLDALVDSGRIDDDCHIVSLVVTKGSHAGEMLVTVSAAP